MIDKILTWIKSNLIIAILILVAVILFLFPRQLNSLFGGRHRIKHRPGYYSIRTRSGRRLPRSVGRSKPRKQYTKGGKAKKAWQIKGSLAAKRHMAQIRKMR